MAAPQQVANGMPGDAVRTVVTEGSMNVRLILTLSLFGLLVGIGSIVGLIPSGWELAVWAVIALISAGVLARQAPGKFFLHGFLTGFVAGAVSTLCQALFMNQYLAHNA